MQGIVQYTIKQGNITVPSVFYQNRVNDEAGKWNFLVSSIWEQTTGLQFSDPYTFSNLNVDFI